MEGAGPFRTRTPWDKSMKLESPIHDAGRNVEGEFLSSEENAWRRWRRGSFVRHDRRTEHGRQQGNQKENPNDLTHWSHASKGSSCLPGLWGPRRRHNTIEKETKNPSYSTPSVFQTVVTLGFLYTKGYSC